MMSLLARVTGRGSSASTNAPATVAKEQAKEDSPASRTCWPCTWRLLKAIVLGTVAYYILLSILIWGDNWTPRQAVKAYEPSPAFEQQLSKMDVKFEPGIYQPFVGYLTLGLLPNDLSCGMKGESSTRAMACSVLELIPYPTGVAIAVVDIRGNRSIRMNQWGDWNTVLRALEGMPVPMNHIIDWTVWHELGHIHQLTKDDATRPWFDPGQTHLYSLYKETHSDIFALMSMAQEGRLNRAQLQHLMKAVTQVRQHYSKSDLLHSSDEYLRCVRFDELFVKGEVAPASLKLFEVALQRKAAGQCFNAPPAPSAKAKP